MSSKVKISLLLFLIFFTRFFFLTWGQNNFFHPDENNMASALSQLSPQSLNPHFFAYGQFPLYLGYFTLQLFKVSNSFDNSVYVLRFYSAFFSILSLYVIYLLAQKIFTPKLSLLLVLLATFSPGLIQLAHFGTTESFLIFAFLSEIYLAIRIYEQPEKTQFYLISGISAGIALATKISSLIFISPLLLVFLMNFIRSKKRLNLILKFCLFFIFTVSLALLLSPYNILAKDDFLSAMNYETGVAIGNIQVFYTTQFKNTLPYLFQIIHIFPYTSGIFQFIFAIFGLIFLIKTYQIKEKKILYWFLILIPSLIYFLYFGQLYVKWTRFVSPIFFIFPLLSVYFVSLFKNKIWQFILILLACLPGVFFMINYFLPDTRISASQYLISQLPKDANILSESGNVVNLPVSPNNFNINNYDFYNNYPNNLSTELLTTDYIIVPSRRVFKNYSLNYYQHLFDGSLGFMEIKKISPLNDLFLNPENAEETWSVFDRPTIRIYKKVQNLTLEQYENLL